MCNNYTLIKNLIKNILGANSKACMLNTPVVVRLNNIPLVNNGQGEGLTKWKGWAWKLDRILFDIKKIKFIINISSCIVVIN